ncbi:Pleckstrin homology domain-containing protein [Pilaira anomala]|nr:Pleckstrin homology domain-containing protein [Pilaira anomala]
MEENLENKFWHRKQCSNRVFIGPWDLKTPLLPSPPPEHFVENDSESIHSDQSVSSLKLLKSTRSIPSSHHPKIGTPVSDETSFITARSTTTNSTTYNSVNSTSNFLEQIMDQEQDDDEIDYQFLVNANTPDFITMNSPAPSKNSSNSSNSSSNSSSSSKSNSHYDDTASIETVRPIKGKLPIKAKAPITTALNTMDINTTTKRRRRRLHRPRKPLLWKKAGSVFISRSPDEVTPDVPKSIPTNKPLRREPILCMRSIGDCTSSVPSRYKAAREARFESMTEKWRQVQLVLTQLHISTYVPSSLFWPEQKLEHRVYLHGPKKPKQLELYLLSPLDYSFCLRYSANEKSRLPMMATLTFKARSFIKCQEWYMQLYDILPEECKRPLPKWSEVYIPLLDLSVTLPLQHIKHSYEVTMEDVKEAVLTVLEEDALNEKMEKLATRDNLGLCWSTKDRAEWIYWKYSSSDPTRRIDWALGPQSIEQTHRLELRTLQHTPNEIILKENFVLKEPPPVEGFLIFITDLLGRKLLKGVRKANYFASFDQFLFYTSTAKVSEPDVDCILDEDKMPNNIRAHPYVSALSPYTETSDEESRAAEIRRRMRLMTEAKGVIDLSEVSYVRRTFTDEIEEPETHHSRISFGSESPMLPSQPEYRRSGSNLFHPKPQRNNPCVELVMENGLQIKFEAYSGDTCDIWVKYLAQIIVYYKARKEAYKDAHTHDKSVYNDTLQESENTISNGKDQTDTQYGCVHNNHEDMVDTRVWSYCLYEQCRDVVKSGILYYKPPGRGSYSQKMIVLTANGWILLYDLIDRSTTKKTSNHKRRGAVDIAGCYFYSGFDGSKMKKGSNQDDLWKKSARIYSNGLTTDDDSLSCIFSVWKPNLRRYFSSKRQRLRVYRQNQRLNSSGTVWTFLARSRRQKEEWVCALNTITEHMMRSETR